MEGRIPVYMPRPDIILAARLINARPIFFPAAVRDNLPREYRECFVETINYKKNGEEFWNNFSMIPITDKDGEHSHWISIQRDVTEEKNKEKEREQLIRELTQNNKDLKQFWSSSSVVPAWMKYVVGTSLWAAVISYLALAGREHGSD